MKYYKDECLSNFSARFTNQKIEDEFHNDLIGKRFKIVYINAGYFFFWHCYMSIKEGITGARACIAGLSLLSILLIKYLPRKYAQYLLMGLQIVITAIITALNKSRYNQQMETYYYVQGMFQVSFWMIDSQNFLFEAIIMMINCAYTILNYTDDLVLIGYAVMYICGYLITCKYQHNMSDRRLYLALKNFEQWEKINSRIMPNLFIIQKFDFRTHRMLVHDCNKKAKEFNIHKSTENYINFISSLHLVDNITSSNRGLSLSTKHQYESLKEVLLEKHALIYSNYLSEERKSKHSQTTTSTRTTTSLKKKKIPKNENIHSNSGGGGDASYQTGGDQEELSESEVEQVEVYMVHPVTKKRVYFRVKIITLFMNEPFLIICMEDISKLEKIKLLKRQKIIQKDIVTDLLHCVKHKIYSIQSQTQASAQFISKQLFFTRFTIESFLSTIRSLKIQEFLLSEVLENVQNIFSSEIIVTPQQSNHETTTCVQKNHSRINIQFENTVNINQNSPDELVLKQDKGFMFFVISAILSSLKIANVIRIESRVIKDKFSERLSMAFIAKNCEQVSRESPAFLEGIFDTLPGNHLNNLCNTYLKLVMKQICLTSEIKVTSLSDDNDDSVVAVGENAKHRPVVADYIIEQNIADINSEINHSSRNYLQGQISSCKNNSKESAINYDSNNLPGFEKNSKIRIEIEFLVNLFDLFVGGNQADRGGSSDLRSSSLLSQNQLKKNRNIGATKRLNEPNNNSKYWAPQFAKLDYPSGTRCYELADSLVVTSVDGKRKDPIQSEQILIDQLSNC